MKKILLSLALVTCLCSCLCAAEIGAGYNNQAPTVRYWWNENFCSELSLAWNFMKQDSQYPYYSTSSSFSYTIAPLIWCFYRNQFGTLSLSLKFKNYLNYYELGSKKWLTANNYAAIIALPEFEINFPYVDGLKIIGSIGTVINWGYSANGGTLEGFGVNFYGISLAGLGVLYYFNLGSGTKPSGNVIEVKETETKGVTTTAK
jgi:hypothetical protein